MNLGNRWLATAVLGILAISASGCANQARHAAQGSGAPGIASDDAPARGRNTANPNAQYAVLEPNPKLIPRPTIVDASQAAICDPDHLSVSEIAANMNGTFHSVKVAIMNRDVAACKIGGYPSVTLQDEKLEIVGTIQAVKTSAAAITAQLSPTTKVTDTEPAPEVVLAPHSVAAFEIGWTSGPSCAAISRILVTVPGSEESFPINHMIRVCAGRIQVTALSSDQGDL